MEIFNEVVFLILNQWQNSLRFWYMYLVSLGEGLLSSEGISITFPCAISRASWQVEINVCQYLWGLCLFACGCSLHHVCIASETENLRELFFYIVLNNIDDGCHSCRLELPTDIENEWFKVALSLQTAASVNVLVKAQVPKLDMIHLR